MFMRMKIAFASSGSGGLDDTVSPTFGRARVFTIVELENGEVKNVTTVQNPAAQLPGGAGIQAAQFIAEHGVTHVVAGNFGPNASMVLAQMGIEMITMEGIPIKNAIERIKSGDYQRFEIPSAPGVPMPGFDPGLGGGFGRGWGPGRGFFQRWPWQGPWSWTSPWMGPVGPEREIEIQYLEFQKRILEEQIKFLKEMLKEIEERIKRLREL